MSVSELAPEHGDVNRAFILEKCHNFVSFQLWPLSTILNPEGWLSNFHEEEQGHALVLLNSFLYFNEVVTDQLFSIAFRNISSVIRRPNDDFAVSAARWRQFKDNAIVTYVTGEEPNPTDSGQLFSRKARQKLEISQDQIYDPKAALSAALLAPHRPIVFVDDFVGSGNQFVCTWKRIYETDHGSLSFEEMALKSPDASFYYTPAIATSIGTNKINRRVPRVRLISGNILKSRHSALHPFSVVWPQSMRETGPKFIANASARAGIPDLNGDEGCWRGFRKLGLSIAFVHSTPDASLPIFYWESNGWIPLVKRR